MSAAAVFSAPADLYCRAHKRIKRDPRDSNFESIDSVYSVSNKFYINENDLCKIILDELGMK